MALMTSTGTGQDIISAAIRALFNRAKDEQASELYYQDLGLTDYEPDVPQEQLNGISGPGRGILTIEGQQYGSNDKTRGYPVTLTMRKYTSELSWTEEDIHWIAKATSSSKRAMELKSMASEAMQALNQNINEDACKVFYLGFGSTFLTVGRRIIAHFKSSLINGETLIAKAKTTLSKALCQLQRLSEMTMQVA